MSVDSLAMPTSSEEERDVSTEEGEAKFSEAVNIQVRGRNQF